VLPRTELADLGFHLILYPLAGLFSAARAIESLYRQLLTEGTTLAQRDQLMSFEEFNSLIGVEEKYAMLQRFEAP
jgi:2-methylisocitrate lyase-like PEP mutase family enzyme